MTEIADNDRLTGLDRLRMHLVDPDTFPVCFDDIEDVVSEIDRALQDERDGGWDSGYLAGFKASGEGWNGEYPFEGRAPELDEHWLATRDKSRPPHSKDSEG